VAVLTFIKQHISTANASTYTFSSTSTGGANDIGALASDRRVFIGANITASTSATRTINTITTGGVSATIVIKINGARSAGFWRAGSVGLAHAAISTATSVNVVLTATTTVANAGVTVWSATEAAASAATYGISFSSSTVGWQTASAATLDINPVGIGGFYIVEHGSLTSATHTVTDTTVDHETIKEQTTHLGSHGTTSATVGIEDAAGATSDFSGAVWMAFDTTTSTVGTGETLYRRTTAFTGQVTGRRTLVAKPGRMETIAYLLPTTHSHEARP